MKPGPSVLLLSPRDGGGTPPGPVLRFPRPPAPSLCSSDEKVFLGRVLRAEVFLVVVGFKMCHSEAKSQHTSKIHGGMGEISTVTGSNFNMALLKL